MDLYFIALIPPENLKERIHSIKEEIKEKYGAKKALRLPAHITLQIPFRMEAENEAALMTALQDFTRDRESFKIHLSGFGAFPPRVLFIRIVDHSPLAELHQPLQAVVDEIVDLKENERTSEIHPHITIASRDLTKAAFKEAWPAFKERHFEASFPAEKLSLLKHNGKTWDVHREFNFERNPV